MRRAVSNRALGGHDTTLVTRLVAGQPYTGRHQQKPVALPGREDGCLGG
jgi:hypothetical protein